MTHPLTPLFNLIQQHSNMSFVRDLLRSRNAFHSASSWDALIEARVIPALAEGTITEADLHELLRRTEEFGSQHIFLFKCAPATAAGMCTEDYLGQVLPACGLGHLLNGPLALEEPQAQTIIDARIDYVDTAPCLVVKTAEPRVSWRYSREEVVGEELHRISEKVFVRSSNVARLWHDGTLEVRIASHSNSTKYAQDLEEFLSVIDPVFGIEKFREHSLRNAKDYITKNARELIEVLCVSQAKYRDSEGYSITAAAGSRSDTLANSARIDGAVGSFNNAEDETFCEQTHVWFMSKEGQDLPSRDIHVILSGEVHEFAVTSKCSPEDYEYILQTISRFNTPVSG